MDNEIQPSIAQVESLPQVPPLTPPTNSWSKILLLSVLAALFTVATLVIGIRIGRAMVLKQNQAITATPTPTATTPPSTPTPTVKQSCQTVMSKFVDSNTDHGLSISIEQSTQNEMCQLAYKGNYSLLLPKDWEVSPSGYMGSPAIALTRGSIHSNTWELYTLFINKEFADDKTTMDLANAEKTVIAGKGGTSTLFGKVHDVLEKQLITIGTHQVLVITTTFNTEPKTGKYSDYEKTFILFNQPDGEIYEFVLRSNRSAFDNPESVEMIKATKEIIASFELK